MALQKLFFRLWSKPNAASGQLRRLVLSFTSKTHKWFLICPNGKETSHTIKEAL